MVRNRGGQASSGESETESERSAVGAVQGGMRYALPPHACCAEMNPAVPAPRVAGEVSVPRVAAKVPGLRAAAELPRLEEALLVGPLAAEGADSAEVVV